MTMKELAERVAPAFSPGPWRLDRTNGELMVLSSAQTTDEMGDTYPVPVADLYRGGYDYADLGHSLEANARLIAAAPELYEAAEALAGMTCQTTGAEDAESGCCCVCRARAAIAKARARASQESAQ
jgi:hypothetical protein